MEQGPRGEPSTRADSSGDTNPVAGESVGRKPTLDDSEEEELDYEDEDRPSDQLLDTSRDDGPSKSTE